MQSKTMGWEFEYLSKIFQISTDQINGARRYIVIAPVYFKIENIEFTENEIRIDYICNTNEDIDFVIDFYKQHGNMQPAPIPGIQFSHKINGIDSKLFSIIKPINTSLDHRFRIDVYSKTGVILDTISGNVSDFYPTKSKITIPVYPIFKNFVSYEKFKKLILQTEDKKGKPSKTNFEKGVSWLLTLLGFNTIWLGDDYQYSGIGVNQVSIDILGSYNSEKILLVNPSLGTPDPATFSLNQHYRERICATLDNPSIKFISLIFTNRPTSTCLHRMAQESNITLIGKNEIENILEFLENGDIQSAKNIIIPRNEFESL